MFCEKCGAPLEQDAKFCPTCGSVVGSDTMQQTQPFANNGTGFNSNVNFNGGGFVDNSVNNGFDNNYNSNFNNTANNGFNANGYNTVNSDNNYVNYMQPSPMPKSKKPVFVGLLAIVLVAGLLVAGYFTVGKNLFSKDPVKKTMTALGNLAKSDAVDSTTEIKLKLKGSGQSALAAGLIQNMSIRINSKYSKNTSNGEFSLALVYNNQVVVNADIYADKDLAVITSPQLLDQPLYAKISDLKTLTGTDVKTMPIDTSKYQDFIKSISSSDSYKAIESNYGTFFETTLKEFTKNTGSVDVNVTQDGKARAIKCDEVTITIDEKFVQKVVSGILTKISEDKDIKALIKDKAAEFINLAEKNGDLEALGVDKAEFEKELADFDTNWDKAMTELKNNLGNVDKELAALKLNSTAKVKVDSSNQLRQLTYEIDGGTSIGDAAGMPGLSGSVVIETTFNAYGSDVKINKPSTSNAKNIAEMDQFELLELTQGISEKAQQIFMSQFGK